jgi:type I restriction enzyme M protein
MQTNREDVGDRWREILLPAPKNSEWAASVSRPFRDYFSTIASSRKKFLDEVTASGREFIASVKAEEESAVEQNGGDEDDNDA